MFEKLLKSELGINIEKEYRFHPTRKWRADYAILEFKIIIEVEGAVWTNGRHTRGSGFLKDVEKYNSATSMGWSVLRTTPKDLLSGTTIALIKETIKNKCLQNNITAHQEFIK